MHAFQPGLASPLVLGLRQGEALGLKWSDVDLDAGVLVVRRARLRPRWRPGCDGKCGHQQGGRCPQRITDRTETAATKSRAGRRTIGLPDQLVMLLRRHRASQAAEREAAAQLWNEDEGLFATPTGAPINPRTDYAEWKRLLTAAGVRDARLHDARHTAATVSSDSGRPRAGGHGSHGLVEQRDGRSVPARDGVDPAGHPTASRSVHLVE